MLEVAVQLEAELVLFLEVFEPDLPVRDTYDLRGVEPEDPKN